MPNNENVSYGDDRRPWHSAFVEYMGDIVDHEAYEGMPCARDDTGKIDWTIPSNRSRGSKNWDGNQRRREWWMAKAQQVGVPVEGHWLSRTAKIIHPFGQKPCQTCGRVLKLAYVYPNETTIKALNGHLPSGQQLTRSALLTIDEVTDRLASELGTEATLKVLSAVFPKIGKPVSTSKAKQGIHFEYTIKERKLSPGAMSNAPDRLDGFHTYNLCCRSKQDRGRDRANLATYSVDRRAYEQWSEGDWAIADLVMASAGEGKCLGCNQEGPLSADHIGPISLGFAHSPNFRPLCVRCNAGKNNRMSHRDISELLALEDAGHTVTSWQITALWDNCKTAVVDDTQALLLSKLLRIQQHNYLESLGRVAEAGLPDLLLQFLHPEFAHTRIELVDFDPATLTFGDIRHEPRQDGYATSRGARMVRIAFDALRDYGAKTHRNLQVVDPLLVQPEDRDFQEVLDAEQSSGSPLRDQLIHVLSLDVSAEVRDEAFVPLTRQVVDPDASNRLRNALIQLLEAHSQVLFSRHQRGDAVSWDDFADG